MHTILGAGGPVANSLTPVLLDAGETVRLASRRPVTAFSGASWIKTDLTNFASVTQAVDGSSVVYVCAGLQYNKQIWANQWPVIIKNVINAAKDSGARFIFFDNVYMYGLVPGSMTEETPYRPVSVKGEIRARIAEELMNNAKAGNIRATIARAADFYGAASLNSFIDSMVLMKYAKKQKAMWLGNAHKLHSFTYVPDTGKALYTLAKDRHSDNQVWHLPTAPAISGREFISLAAKVFDVKASSMGVNKFMLRTMGLFNKLIRETVEMYYQYDHDYIFSSQKFEKHYGIQPTSYEKGLLSERVRLS